MHIALSACGTLLTGNLSTRRSQSPPGARPHAGTSSHGSGQRPIRCPLHTTAASPCRARPRLALPSPALPRPAQSGCFRILPANVMRWRWDTKKGPLRTESLAVHLPPGDQSEGLKPTPNAIDGADDGNLGTLAGLTECKVSADSENQHPTAIEEDVIQHRFSPFC